MEKNDPAKNGMTIDDLARIVQGGFLSVEGRLDNVERKLGSVEGRLGSVEGRLGSVEGRLNKIENDVDAIKTTVDNIQADLHKKVDRIDHNTLTYRVEKLEKKFA
ncbi:MAG: hypothetical protein Q8L10_04150 [Candidatus Moranbacteria bacterium]|nr:hypothetical protein [Candidatus Moranbacteria bacterium]